MLSRRRAVLVALRRVLINLLTRPMSGSAYVSFSKVTDADFGASAASDDGVTEMDVIFPL